jgi:hypothetical protein
LQAKKSTLIIVFTIAIMTGTCFTPLTSPQTIMRSNSPTVQPFDGNILYCPLYGKTTYLIDNKGAINHTWNSSYTPGCSTYWLGNGEIMRTIRTDLYAPGGAGGGVRKLAWDGTIEWEYHYDTDGNLSHHDISVLPNGNVLMITWETKSFADAIAAGRNPLWLSGDAFMPTHIIEVKPTGPTSGDIVWEWHVWDHLIQDFDSSKANYGVVGDHPELVNINYNASRVVSDWLHVNSIDYNATFDQILISVHNFCEVWVIDHSTTRQEAAGHSGGRYGKGGDLLYRWGNPQAYDAGTPDDEQLFGEHDASWIQPGCPGAGHILVFNNGVGRPGSPYSSVDEFAPPMDAEGNYYLEPGSAYGPENVTWRYTASPPTSFYAGYISGAQRLPDGNTLICDGVAGRFFEVTPEKTTIWAWTNPYPVQMLNDVFNIAYVPPEEPPHNDTPDLACDGMMNWTNVKAGDPLQGSFQVYNIGGMNSSLNWRVDTYPDWGNWTFTPTVGYNLTPSEGPVTVQVSVTAPGQQNTEFQGFIRVINTDNPDDFDLVPVVLTTSLMDITVRTNLIPILSPHALSLFGIVGVTYK